MVKASLVKGSTTRTIGKRIAAWIRAAKCGVMVRYRGIEIAVLAVEGLTLIVDGGFRVGLNECRIHRETVRQIRSMIGV